MSDTMDTPQNAETMEAPQMGETAMEAPQTGTTTSLQMRGTMEARAMDAPTMGDAMNGTMRAVSQDELGGPEVLKLVSLPIPEPGVSQILLRVHAAGVNPIDGANRETGAFVGEPPFVLGWDVCGSVEAVGPGVTLYNKGDVVFGLLPFPQGHGAYAEYVVGPARAFVPKPDALDHVHAAAIPMVGLTAWQALVDTARVGDGTRVLVTGAAGGIGHFAVQIAKARGAYVTAVASAADLDFVRSLGADEAIDYNGADLTAGVRDQDVVLDVVGGDYPARALDVLKPGRHPRVHAAADAGAARRDRDRARHPPRRDHRRSRPSWLVRPGRTGRRRQACSDDRRDLSPGGSSRRRRHGGLGRQRRALPIRARRRRAVRHPRSG